MSTEQKQQKEKVQEAIAVPEGINFSYEDRVLIVKGKAGEVRRKFYNPTVNISKQGNKIILVSGSQSRKNKRIFNTTYAHIRNMINGADKDFTYKLKICSGHFPMTVKIDGGHVVIANFLGEKIPRKAAILPNVKIKVEKDIITINSPDKEAAGQTAANIERATNLGKRDIRVFQDGCYIIEKPGRE